MKTIKVEIEGTSPLLMNRYNIEAELERQKGKRVTKVYDNKEEAFKSAYWNKSGKSLMIPAINIYASILNASSFHKINRRSAKSILAGSLRVMPEEVDLGTDKYEIDLRPVVIQRARVLKARARLDKWGASFQIIFNENLISDPIIIKTVLEEAGLRIGLMDYRPQKSGYYGTFKIIKFQVQK